MLLRLSITSIFIILTFSSLSSETKGSVVEIYTKNNKIIKGELIEVDSFRIELFIKLPKTSSSNMSNKTIYIDNHLCDSVIIVGSFDGASPYVISGILGIAATALTIGGSDKPNYYIGGALGAIIGFFSYLFIDNTLSVDEIILTEIDIYPWKLKPYSRNYKSSP